MERGNPDAVTGSSDAAGERLFGTTAVTGVRDIEAAFLVQSHSRHIREQILEPVKA
jgi:hypothetical protein